jgi:hypothetical protein
VKIEVPRYNYNSIREKAVKFRERMKCVSRECPIEKIVEFELDMDIVPIPGLQQILDTSGVLSQDLSRISVDEYCYLHMEERYRFTLAHEVGHLELHADLYRHIPFKSVTEWREAISSLLTEEEYQWLEWQADAFAGVVLVAPEHLIEEYKTQSSQIKSTLRESNAVPEDLQELFEVALREMCYRIAPTFNVSTSVVDTRLHYDGLKTEFKKLISS